MNKKLEIKSCREQSRVRDQSNQELFVNKGEKNKDSFDSEILSNDQSAAHCLFYHFSSFRYSICVKSVSVCLSCSWLRYHHHILVTWIHKKSPKMLRHNVDCQTFSCFLLLHNNLSSCIIAIHFLSIPKLSVITFKYII